MLGPPRSPLGRAAAAIRGARWRWWATFAALFVMTSAWSLATPLMASPDEPAHTVKAAAVVRGQFYGTPARPTSAGASPYITVRVPAVFASTGTLPGCYAFKAAVPASCAPALRPGGPVVKVETPAGRYEPIYYLAVGLPSLVWRSAVGIRLMRLVGALVCCAFLASAFESARAARSRWGVAGVAAACTPMALFLAATVNPSGLEIASAVCMWASGLALVLGHDHAAPAGRLVARLGLSSCVLVQVRSLSLLWTALIGLAFLAVARKERLLELVRRTDVRVWLGIFAVSVVFAGVWLLAFSPLAQIPTPPAHQLSGTTVLETSIGKFDLLVREMIGVLGWTDTFPPALTFYGWLVVVGLVLGLGLSRAGARVWGCAAAVTAVTVALPVILESSQANRYGFVWQGRYTLPFAVGIPILAGMAVPDDLAERLGRRGPWSVAAVLVVAQGAMFVVALRRYTVGLAGPLDPFGGRWHPPLGSVTVTVVFGLALLAFGALVALPDGSAARAPER